MSIGTGADYYNGINRGEDKRVKLGDEVQKWFDGLDEDEKLIVLESTYPDQVGMISCDELWERTSWNDKWDIYREANGFARDYE